MNKNKIALLLILSFLIAPAANAKMTKEAHNLYKMAVRCEAKQDYSTAIKYLEKAISINGDDSVLFTKIAGIYTAIGDNTSALNYYKKALESAKYLKDDFKIALIYFEFAQNYYDKGDDKKALINFLNAKSILKNSSDTENLNRIEKRVQDIKLRLDKMTFDMIAEKYEQ